MGGDKIKALAKVIPRMESPSDARLLKNTILRQATRNGRRVLDGRFAGNVSGRPWPNVFPLLAVVYDRLEQILSSWPPNSDTLQRSSFARTSKLVFFPCWSGT